MASSCYWDEGLTISNKNQRNCFLLIFLVSCILLGYSFTQYPVISYSRTGKPFKRNINSCWEHYNFPPVSDLNSSKIILFWNKFFDNPNPYLHDKMKACRHRCFLTDDRQYLRQSSAVVFHIRNLNQQDLPPCRNPDQFYVFFLLESPPHTIVDLNGAPWSGFFNLTWTYRNDSDIFSSFYLDGFRPELWTDRQASRISLQKKSNRALIFSSNCNTHGHREVYIDELKRHFPIDIIGTCGDQKCDKHDVKCDSRVQTYKFYLSFENSYCLDYVTEKAIRPLNFGAVPVVFGGANYTGLLPKNSFIDTKNFASPKHLAEHLHFLVNNSAAFEKYYEWKFRQKNSRLSYNPDKVSVCKLCDSLQDENFEQKVYWRLHEWWVEKANCSTYIRN